MFHRETSLDAAAYHAARNIVTEVQQFAQKFARDPNRRRGIGPGQWKNPYALLLYAIGQEDYETFRHFAQELETVRKHLRW